MKITIKIDTTDKEGIEKAKIMLAALDAPGTTPRTKNGAPVPPGAVMNEPLNGERDVMLALPITELAVKPRVHSALMKCGYTTIGHVVPLTLNQIREVDDVGRVAAASIVRALEELRLR